MPNVVSDLDVVICVPIESWYGQGAECAIRYHGATLS